MKALAGTVCALLTAGCWAPGTLVPQYGTALFPYAPAPALARAAPHAESPEIPVVALPAEMFAPEPAPAAAPQPLMAASPPGARPGLVETAYVVPASAEPAEPAEPAKLAEQGPMLIPGGTQQAAMPVLDEPDGPPIAVTVSAQAVTLVQNPAAAAGASAAPQVAASQPSGPTIVHPGPVPAGIAPGAPAFVAPGGPAVIDPRAPVFAPEGALPASGAPFGPCETCPPWVSGGGCGACDPCDPCGLPCQPVCNPAGFVLFGEFLFLTARGVDVPFATPVDGLGVNAVPIGNTRVSDPAYDPGFRVGGAWSLGTRTNLLLVYTSYESSVSDLHTLPGGTGFLRATLVHPNTANAAADSLSAEADYDIDFRFGDIALSHEFFRDCENRLAGVAGFRYAELDQDLQAAYSILGLTRVDSDIQFEGFGPRIGLDAERLLRPPLALYGNAFVNFLAGDFEGSYVQGNINAPGAPQAAAGIEDDRIVTLLEAEVGIAYCPPCGGWRASVGYYLAGWFNVLTTAEFIEAVQADDFNDADETLTFDGLTARLQFDF
jgi:Legionella pneumophila major outer membrane protein precursor